MSVAEDEIAEEAETLARCLHAEPEVSLEEHAASRRCKRLLEQWGFDLGRGIDGLPTAFTAQAELGAGGGPTIALIAEYDALPHIGHGCGHHLVAGAALEAAGRLATAPTGHGTIVVAGTPAEETMSGKRRMLDAGAFEAADAVLAYHPSDQVSVFGRLHGAALLEMIAHGRSAHAASRPWTGRNAQDAAVLLHHALSMERLYHGDDARIHSHIASGDGAHNALASFSCVEVNLRSPEVEVLRTLEERAHRIAEGVAAATDTRIEVHCRERAAPYKMDPYLAELAWEILGVPPGTTYDIAGSSDLGDVSQSVPTVCITRSGWDPVPWHSAALHEAAGTPGAFASMHEAALNLEAIARRFIRDHRLSTLDPKETP